MSEYSKTWLDYDRYADKDDKYDIDGAIYHLVVIRRNGRVMESAIREVVRAVKGMFGVEPDIISVDNDTSIPDDVSRYIRLSVDTDTYVTEDDYDRAYHREWYGSEEYIISEKSYGISISATVPTSLLYGVYALFYLIRSGEIKERITGDDGHILSSATPEMPIRMINHWDNMDGSIERGYSGHSFFFRRGQFIHDAATGDGRSEGRITQYARMLSSVGINAVCINNVNVLWTETRLLSDEYVEDLKKYARLFGDYGIKLFISVNYASPMDLGGLKNCDPLDEDVKKWWKMAVARLYSEIPEFGGFVVKADSEGRPGPFTYGRNQADGANLIAKALSPYGGILIWRCFVYNCRQDWRDTKTDRARSAYDYFVDLDGLFDDNVILQIKNGPMDFQVREPVSPLFGGLKKTNMILEVELAQEYTGQQIDLCYLIPMWREVLDFDTHSADENTDKNDSPTPSTVRNLVNGSVYKSRLCGMAAVINTGDDYTWTGNDLAAANLYGFGRLSCDGGLSAKKIATEWSALTFDDKKVIDTVTKLLEGSWKTYEKYTAPLGIGWMVTPHTHYGPDVDGYEFSPWGTYHRADRYGLGVDRSPKGTGYTDQYNEPWKSVYADMDKCPEELLLFFHYVRYDKVLKSGKTLIQHIYDTHFEGVDEVELMLSKWESLEGLIQDDPGPGYYGGNEQCGSIMVMPDTMYQRVLTRLKLQLANAREWRDRINTYFYRNSGVADEKGREIYGHDA